MGDPLKDASVYRVVYLTGYDAGSWWPRNRKSLGCWLGIYGRKGKAGENFRIERAEIVRWVDVTGEFKA